MLPDNYPVFNIQIQDSFQSSDQILSALYSRNKHNTFYPSSLYQQIHNYILFSSIGDRHSNLDCTQVIKKESYDLLAIYDGHNDIETVSYLENNLLKSIQNLIQNKVSFQQAMKIVFQQMEKQIIKKFQKGAVGLVVAITQQNIFVANLGDCRLFGIDFNQNIIPLTTIHNLTNIQQLQKVISKGATVFKKGSQYRINGQLNLSRSFGDRKYKQFMSSQPQIKIFKRKQYKKLILSTDGFYQNQIFSKIVKGNISQLQNVLKNRYIFKDNATSIFYNL